MLDLFILAPAVVPLSQYRLTTFTGPAPAAKIEAVIVKVKKINYDYLKSKLKIKTAPPKLASHAGPYSIN